MSNYIILKINIYMLNYFIIIYFKFKSIIKNVHSTVHIYLKKKFFFLLKSECSLTVPLAHDQK